METEHTPHDKHVQKYLAEAAKTLGEMTVVNARRLPSPLVPYMLLYTLTVAGVVGLAALKTEELLPYAILLVLSVVHTGTFYLLMRKKS